MTDLDAYTGDELEQELASVLAHARGEVLNHTEVQKFLAAPRRDSAASCGIRKRRVAERIVNWMQQAVYSDL
jgi:hypothetical protein